MPDTPDIDTAYPAVSTWTLKVGRYSNPGRLSGTYSVDGDRITFEVPDFDYALAFSFSIDDAGNLYLRPVSPMDAGDRFVWSYTISTKIH